MKKGFSLVELSIVLVILGLLVGGVLSGQALIRAAELRTIPVQHAQIVTAVQQFKDRYFALPGDMTNATDFWGDLGAGSCPSGTGTGTQTCNGDGDGTLDETSASGAYGERFTFWQHLANANLIEGLFTGKAGTGSKNDAIIGVNVLSGKNGRSGWSLRYASNSSGDSEWFASDYQNHLIFGGTITDSYTYGKILKPEDAWNIDKKMDDGKPATGKVIASWWDVCTDAASKSDLDSDYLLSDDGIECSFMFSQAF